MEFTQPYLNTPERLRFEGLRTFANPRDRQVPVNSSRRCIIIGYHLVKAGWATIDVLFPVASPLPERVFPGLHGMNILATSQAPGHRGKP